MSSDIDPFVQRFVREFAIKLANWHTSVPTVELTNLYMEIAGQLFIDDFWLTPEPPLSDGLGHARFKDKRNAINRIEPLRFLWMDLVAESFAFFTTKVSQFNSARGFDVEVPISPEAINVLLLNYRLDNNPDFFRALKPRLEKNFKQKDTKPSDLLNGTHFTPLLKTKFKLSIPRKAFGEHGAVFAKSGHGKTQALRAIIYNFLQEDDPPAIFIIDGLGALIKGLDQLEVFSTRLKDRLVIIDPLDTPALNLFKLQSDDLTLYLFKAIEQSLTDRQATMLAYLMELMRHIDGATLHTLIEVCSTTENKYPNEISKLSEYAQTFFNTQFFGKKPDRHVQDTKAQVANRVLALGRRPRLLDMLSARENKFDAFRFMQEKKFVIINTTGLGEAGTILGRLILAQCLEAARLRPESKRHLALLIVDEAKQYMDEQSALILSDARQFGLGLIIATQFPHQLHESVRREINTNTSVRLFGPVEHSIASQYARDMFTTPEFILRMQSYEQSRAEWACYVSNVTPHAVKLTIPFGLIEQMPKMNELTWKAMRAANKLRYGAAPPAPTTTPPDPVHEKVKPVPIAEPPASAKPKAEPKKPQSPDDLDFNH